MDVHLVGKSGHIVRNMISISTTAVAADSKSPQHQQPKVLTSLGTDELVVVDRGVKTVNLLVFDHIWSQREYQCQNHWVYQY